MGATAVNIIIIQKLESHLSPSVISPTDILTLDLSEQLGGEGTPNVTDTHFSKCNNPNPPTVATKYTASGALVQTWRVSVPGGGAQESAWDSEGPKD